MEAPVFRCVVEEEATVAKSVSHGLAVRPASLCVDVGSLINAPPASSGDLNFRGNLPTRACGKEGTAGVGLRRFGSMVLGGYGRIIEACM